ncbi:MAG: type I-G CRISPR-associated protein, Cas3-extension family, partial [Terriglobales bacterium]
DPMSNQSLHLEPSEDRRHGYQWHEPTGDPSRGQCGGMLGANRLAIEAFPLFRSVAAGDRLSTLGFSGCGTADIRWTWPLWSCRFSPEVVATVLGIAELQQDEPDCRVLRAMGICTAYRCRRILVGKTPNFTPAMPL